jgi:hypothetical protein
VSQSKHQNSSTSILGMNTKMKKKENYTNV